MINLMMGAFLYLLCALFLFMFAYCAPPLVTVLLVLIAFGTMPKSGAGE